MQACLAQTEDNQTAVPYRETAELALTVRVTCHPEGGTSCAWNPMVVSRVRMTSRVP